VCVQGWPWFGQFRDVSPVACSHLVRAWGHGSATSTRTVGLTRNSDRHRAGVWASHYAAAGRQARLRHAACSMAMYVMVVK
jgi:hypothetical protein